MKGGDINSKFFHSFAGARRSSNLVTSLSWDDGIKVISQKELFDVYVSYFNMIFQVDNNCNDFLPIINNIPIYIFPHENDSLLASFSMDEFQITLFHMDLDKSPNPDKLTPAF